MFYLACLPCVIAVLYSHSLMPASSGYWYVLFGLSTICHNCSLFSLSNASFFKFCLDLDCLPCVIAETLFSLSNSSFFRILVCLIWLVSHVS